MSRRVAAIDMGNSRTELALFEDRRLTAHDFLPTAPEYVSKLIQILRGWMGGDPFARIVAASVSPALADLFYTRLEAEFGIRPVSASDYKTRLMPLLVDYPETVGIDRVVNCHSAVCQYGAPAIVVSLGTATTFEVISEKGEYLGGCIAPGVKISLDALTQRTALLPPAVWSKPGRILAKNTLEHMTAGIYYGTVSMIEGMTRRYKEIVGAGAKVIGTGGFSNVIAGEPVFDIHDPMLTLKGLEEIEHRFLGGPSPPEPVNPR